MSEASIVMAIEPTPGPVPTAFVDWILLWVDGLPPGQLQQWAAQHEAIVPHILRQFPAWSLRFVTGYLDPTLMDWLRAAGPREWRAVGDAVLARRGDLASVVWLEEAWFHAQLQAIRDALLNA